MDSDKEYDLQMEVKLINKFHEKLEDDTVSQEEKIELINSMRDNKHIGLFRAEELKDQVKEDD